MLRAVWNGMVLAESPRTIRGRPDHRRLADSLGVCLSLFGRQQGSGSRGTSLVCGQHGVEGPRAQAEHRRDNGG